jgi:hypothetical protein
MISYKNYNNILYCFSLSIIGLILIIFAGLRPIGFDRDILSYLDYLNGKSISNILDLLDKEPFFWLIVYLNNIFFSGAAESFFLIFSFIGVSIKFYAITKLSSFPLLSILIYFCLFYFLHEATQIRVGIAIGIFLLAIPDIVQKRPFLYFLKSILAFCFHYSLIIMVPLYFIKTIKNKYILFIFPLIGLLIAKININILNIVDNLSWVFNWIIPPLYQKISIHLSLLESSNIVNLNLFNSFDLTILIIYIFMVINIEKFKLETDRLMINYVGIMLFIYYSFYQIPVFSTRISDIFSSVLIILLANFINIFKQKTIILNLIFLYSVFMFWNINIRHEIVDFSAIPLFSLLNF